MPLTTNMMSSPIPQVFNPYVFILEDGGKKYFIYSYEGLELFNTVYLIHWFPHTFLLLS